MLCERVYVESIHSISAEKGAVWSHGLNLVWDLAELSH